MHREKGLKLKLIGPKQEISAEGGIPVKETVIKVVVVGGGPRGR